MCKFKFYFVKHLYFTFISEQYFHWVLHSSRLRLNFFNTLIISFQCLHYCFLEFSCHFSCFSFEVILLFFLFSPDSFIILRLYLFFCHFTRWWFLLYCWYLLGQLILWIHVFYYLEVTISNCPVISFFFASLPLVLDLLIISFCSLQNFLYFAPLAIFNMDTFFEQFSQLITSFNQIFFSQI